MIGLCFLFLEFFGLVIGLWLVSVKIYQLLTGLDWESSKADMQYCMRGWIKKEDSFWVLNDPRCKSRIAELIKEYSFIPGSEVKWGESIYQGLPCIYLRLACPDDKRPLASGLVKEAVRETLGMYNIPGDMIIDKWEEIYDFPYLFVIYASNTGERKQFERMMDQEQRKALYAINPKIHDKDLEREYADRL